MLSQSRQSPFFKNFPGAHSIQFAETSHLKQFLLHGKSQVLASPVQVAQFLLLQSEHETLFTNFPLTQDKQLPVALQVLQSLLHYFIHVVSSI